MGVSLARFVRLAAAFVGLVAPSLAQAQAGADAGPSGHPAAGGPQVRVVVSIAPLRGLVEPILKEAAVPHSVDVLIPPGRSEHGYEIPPSKLAQIESADVVALVGLRLDAQVEKFVAALPERSERPRRVVVFADAIGILHDAEKDEPAEDGEHHHHEHGEAKGEDGESGDCGHDHHTCDPHLWLDPVLVEKFVPVLTEALATAAGSEGGADARVRAAGLHLRERVLGLHEAYTKACDGFAGKTIVVGHDAWGRLAERYGLETVAIAGLTAGEPTPQALERARSTVREKGLKAVFVEPQLSDRAGRRIAAATGVEVRTLDPLGTGDWFALMQSNLVELQRALGAAPAPATPSPQPAKP